MASNAEIGKTIEKFMSVRTTRRDVLTKGTLAAIGGLIAGASITDMVVDTIKTGYIEKEFEATYPPEPENIKQGVKRYRELQAQAIELAKQGNLEAVAQIARSEEYIQATQASIQGRVYHDARIIEYSKRVKETGTMISKSPGFSFGSFGVGGLTLVAELIQFAGATEALRRARESASKRVELLRPQWISTPPSEEEITIFDRPLSYLPPVGGKIPRTDKGTVPQIDEGYRPGLIPPTYISEEQTDLLVRLRREGVLDNAYVHQISVQGRLPDRFKYAAIALILNSPYQNNWQEPFFDAPWGKVAPLVHDGGNTDRTVNPLWKTKGRTDFLQRISIVKEPELDQLEQLTTEQRRKLPVERQSAAGHDLQEEARSKLETKFYQRTGFALHAEVGTAPKAIPQEKRKAAAKVWASFEDEMQDLLEEYGVEGAGGVTWLYNEPQEKDGWPEYRREAEWEPIQKELIRLEQVKAEHPEIRERVGELIHQVTVNVDNAIGIG